MKKKTLKLVSFLTQSSFLTNLIKLTFFYHANVLKEVNFGPLKMFATCVRNGILQFHSAECRAEAERNCATQLLTDCHAKSPLPSLSFVTGIRRSDLLKERRKNLTFSMFDQDLACLD